MKGQEVLNHMRKTDKHSESSIEFTAHTHIHKQQKQVNGSNHHILLNINIKNTPFAKLD
jgi:hypothetical protein